MSSFRFLSPQEKKNNWNRKKYCPEIPFSFWALKTSQYSLILRWDTTFKLPLCLNTCLLHISRKSGLQKICHFFVFFILPVKSEKINISEMASALDQKTSWPKCIKRSSLLQRLKTQKWSLLSLVGPAIYFKEFWFLLKWRNETPFQYSLDPLHNNANTVLAVRKDQVKKFY